MTVRQITRLPPIERVFCERPTPDVARDLLGKLLIRRTQQGVTVLRITEVEAYVGVSDPACHTFGGRRTARNEVMWGEAGRLYVYFTYGMHFCANVVTRGEGEPEAVLLRGGAPIAGPALMEARRGGARRGIADGPAKLCQAMAIDRALNGADLTQRSSGIWLAANAAPSPSHLITTLPRVGVGYAGDAAQWPLRFLLRTE